MIIIDNFLQDKKILIEILKEETWSNFPTYNWWDGWWKCKPRNIMEILIEMIWKRLNIAEAEKIDNCCPVMLLHKE